MLFNLFAHPPHLSHPQSGHCNRSPKPRPPPRISPSRIHAGAKSQPAAYALNTMPQTWLTCRGCRSCGRPRTERPHLSQPQHRRRRCRRRRERSRHSSHHRQRRRHPRGLRPPATHHLSHHRCHWHSRRRREGRHRVRRHHHRQPRGLHSPLPTRRRLLTSPTPHRRRRTKSSVGASSVANDSKLQSTWSNRHELYSWHVAPPGQRLAPR